DGRDPISTRPFIQEVLEGLTLPLTDEDMKGVAFERTTPRLLEPDTEENLHRLFLENDWTDKLPIVLPTEERVATMLAGTSHAAGEVVGRLRPAEYREFWEFTVEQAAVNAVMAGAEPAYFPTILALLGSCLSARHSSTTSIGSMVVVNGPIRHEIGMNSGTGALGPYNHANTTIGRAYGLASQNLQGGSVPGLTYMGSVGNNFAYTNLVFAENEERSPWEPYHVQQGFDKEASTATIFKGIWSLISTWGVRETWQERAKHMFGALESRAGAVMLLDPIVAHEFCDREGFVTKDKLAEWVYDNVRKPPREYWDNFQVQVFLAPLATSGIEPFAGYLKAAPDELIPMFLRDDVHVVVVGGETQPHWSIVSAITSRSPAGGVEIGKTVSIDEWR
ncbi:MAG: UGSC family (seleno)protein, partial [bacterium]